MNAPFFSIITICFNPGELFVITANSLINQTYKNFEWIVVDGLSNPQSLRVIDEYMQQISKFVSEPDNGISDAWNKGIRMSEGKYILLLNAGDSYDDDFLEGIVSSCHSSNVIAAGARMMIEGRYVAELLPKVHLLHRGMYLPHNWIAIPKHVYDQVGGYTNIDLSMDYEWLKRYLSIYGIKNIVIFNRTFGSYLADGKSDRHYIKSFYNNFLINIKYKNGFFLSAYIFIGSTFKHSVSRLFR